MKFLKRLYACLKHYELPRVIVSNGYAHRMTGAWYVNHNGTVMFEVIHEYPDANPYFAADHAIQELQQCR